MHVVPMERALTITTISYTQNSQTSIYGV